MNSMWEEIEKIKSKIIMRSGLFEEEAEDLALEIVISNDKDLLDCFLTYRYDLGISQKDFE